MQGKRSGPVPSPYRELKRKPELISQLRLKVNIRISSTRDTNLSFLVENPASF